MLQKTRKRKKEKKELNKRRRSCGSTKDSMKLFQTPGFKNIKDLEYHENCA